jgi:hypothetical protein
VCSCHVLNRIYGFNAITQECKKEFGKAEIL